MPAAPTLPRRPLALAALLAFGATVAAACSGTPEPHVPPPPPSAPPPPAPSLVPEAPEAGAPVSATPIDGGVAESDGGADAEAPKVAEGPAACPEDMVLIDGDYCTEVETKCLKSHYAKQNKKTICEKFEEPSKCVGAKQKR